MADTSHLEKMGRELKCPICLSLLNSAVSLSCNHVFCNCCIEKSMKSVSNCPVCKVPFHRREIRPALHMDNLVSIYKSMEVASGVNIFVTQTAPSTRISGYETHPDNYTTGGIQDNSKFCIGTAAEDDLKRCKRMGSRRLAHANSTNSSSIPVKPSFPAKKRVLVPQCPPSETQIRSEKWANETTEITKSEPHNSFVIKNKPVHKEKGEPLFTPFFWLRDEEDAEKTTQQTDGNGDQIMETPPNAPCFSDIKDSDDEVPNEMAPEEKTHNAYSDAEFFDSEMFEWTQRACSPELHSSPMRMKADDRTECGVEEKKGSISPIATTIMESKVQNMEIIISETDQADLRLPCSSSFFPSDNVISKKIEMTGKRIKKAVENTQSKRAKKNTGNASRAHKESEKMPGPSMPEEKFENNGSVLNLTKKNSKRRKKVSFEANGTEASGIISTGSSGANLKVQSDIKIVVDLPALPGHKKQRNGSNLKKTEKISKKNISLMKEHAASSRAITLKAATGSLTPNQCEVLTSNSPNILSSDEKEVSDVRRVLRKCVGNHGRKEKKARFEENLKISAKDTENSGAYQDNANSRDADNLSRLEAIHLPSGTSPNTIRCAFCQSTEDSEASGVMVHYLKGKSIAGDEIRGPYVIHAHKNCTEWAPNVFFKDDSTINLEAELARSRKIKCGLCGMRGAALGCFQKSCRKSFHVPCAKMTAEFRWDYDNFVVLCPLHASCKLPYDDALGSQSKQKRKPAFTGNSSTQQPLLVKDDTREHPQWKSHKKAKNLLLCCSGLTDVEKDFVSQFQRLSRVTVSQHWDLSVTHVVASTDENGACKRTLKFLMGVLEGKWIVDIEWVKACIKSMELVDEQLYEIKVDSHGFRDGPTRGRLRLLDKKPKLFSGCKFFFVGEFVPSYKGYLHDLVIAAGGTVLNRKPISENQEIFSSKCSTLTTFIVYSLEQHEKCEASKRNSMLNRRRLEAEALATSTGAVAVSSAWILNSIARCELQNVTE